MKTEKKMPGSFGGDTGQAKKGKRFYE